jgi:carbonic anhydrase
MLMTPPHFPCCSLRSSMSAWNTVSYLALSLCAVKRGTNFHKYPYRILPAKVIVVGHSHCGGASACLAASCTATDSAELVPVPIHPPTDPLNVWLKPLMALAVSLKLSKKPQAEALRILVDENVKVQVATVAETEVIKKAWAGKKGVWVHGWVFDIETGLLRDLKISRES